MKYTGTRPTLTGQRTSPFVEMTRAQRAAVVLFVLVYNAFVPGFSQALHQPSFPLAAMRFGAELAYQGLLVFPFIYYKPGFGWLHPLIFTVIWPLALRVAASPEMLLSPVQVFADPVHPGQTHAALAGFSEQEVGWTLFEAKAIQCLSLVAYYFGFFSGLRPSVPELTTFDTKHVQRRVLLLVGAAFVVFLVFVEMRGGVVNHFLSLAQGRQRAIGGMGHFGVLILIGVIATVAWYALDSSAGTNIFFWGALVASLTAVFLSSGSRSDVILPLAILLFIRTLRRGEIPWARAATVAAIALLLFGMLGVLRASTGTGDVAWEVVTDFQVSRALERAGEGAKEENIGGGYTAIVGRVPRDVEFMYGRTYLGAILFFVPRAVWEDKPRGVGPYVNKYLYRTSGNVEMADSPPQVGGIPGTAVGAAYWNFYIPGVIIIFLVYGVFHRWLAAFYKNNENAVGALFLVYTLVEGGVSPGGIISIMHNTILIYSVLVFLGVLKVPFMSKRF